MKTNIKNYGLGIFFFLQGAVLCGVLFAQSSYSDYVSGSDVFAELTSVSATSTSTCSDPCNAFCNDGSCPDITQCVCNIDSGCHDRERCDNISSSSSTTSSTFSSSTSSGNQNQQSNQNQNNRQQDNQNQKNNQQQDDQNQNQNQQNYQQQGNQNQQGAQAPTGQFAPNGIAPLVPPNDTVQPVQIQGPAPRPSEGQSYNEAQKEWMQEQKQAEDERRILEQQNAWQEQKDQNTFNDFMKHLQQKFSTDSDTGQVSSIDLSAGAPANTEPQEVVSTGPTHAVIEAIAGTTATDIIYKTIIPVVNVMKDLFWSLFGR